MVLNKINPLFHFAAPTSAMAASNSLILLFATLALFSSMALSTDPSPSPITGSMGGEDCKDTLVSVSRCLPYIAAPPNNVSSISPPECCDAFTSFFYAGNAVCLCYFLKDRSLLGFPIDSSKLLSLASVCVPRNVTSQGNATSVELNCSVLQALSPLGGADYEPPYPPTAGPIASPPSITRGLDSSPSSLIITPGPKSDTEYPPEFPPSESDTEYPDTSSATKLSIIFSGFRNLLEE